MSLLRKTVFLLAIATALLAELGCGDQYRPVANPVISPGGQPQATHYAWVANNNGTTGDGSISEIDVSGDTVLSVTSMGKGTSFEALPANSLSLYAANAAEDTVMQYLPTLSGAVTTISLLAGSHPIYLTSNKNTFMYVLNSGTNSACTDSGSISTISTATQSVSNTTCIGINPVAMVQSQTKNWIYVINQGDSTQLPSVSVLDPSGPTLYPSVTLGTAQNPVKPVAIATNAQGWIFVVTQDASTGAGTLDIIPSGYYYIAATASLGVLPNSVFVDPNRDRLYVTNGGDNTVSVFDASNVNLTTQSIPLLATVPVGTQPTGVTALLDGSNFYVANSGSDNVTVVSQSSFSPLATIALPSGAHPTYVASEPTSQRVYVTDQGTSQTTIIHTVNNTVAQNLNAPTQVYGCTSSCALQTPFMVISY
jgi:DNA-binding beta-propeller fold protein YncE